MGKVETDNGTQVYLGDPNDVIDIELEMNNKEDKGALLSMKEILDTPMDELTKSTEMMQKILYARPINSDDANVIYSALKTITEQQSSIEDIYNNVFDILAATGTQAFDTGTTATQEKQKLEDIITSFDTLKSSYEDLNNKYIYHAIETYNARLALCKNGVKKKLLIQAADKVNQAAIDGKSPYVVLTLKKIVDSNTLPQDGPVFGKNEYVKYSNPHKYTELSTDPSEGPKEKTEYTETHYAYLKYWGWFKGDLWTWFDWDEDKIISKFNQYGIPLPYDPSAANGGEETWTCGGLIGISV